jgi:hypothetical protein
MLILIYLPGSFSMFESQPAELSDNYSNNY